MASPARHMYQPTCIGYKCECIETQKQKIIIRAIGA